MINLGKLGNVDNVIIVEFGNGTVAVGSAYNNDTKHKSLIFKTIDKQTIGKDLETTGQNTDEFKPEIAIVFKSKESFDVFKYYVNNIESMFLEENWNNNQ